MKLDLVYCPRCKVTHAPGDHKTGGDAGRRVAAPAPATPPRKKGTMKSGPHPALAPRIVPPATPVPTQEDITALLAKYRERDERARELNRLRVARHRANRKAAMEGADKS